MALGKRAVDGDVYHDRLGREVVDSVGFDSGVEVLESLRFLIEAYADRGCSCVKDEEKVVVSHCRALLSVAC